MTRSPRSLVIVEPDSEGFEIALHDIFPGQDFLTFWASFGTFSPLFLDSIRQGTWALTQALIGLALQQAVITQNQYNAIKAAAETYRIPMTL